MKILLDTHIAVWAVSLSSKLSDFERALIASDDHEIAVSVVSLWEIAVKGGPDGRRADAFPFRARVGLKLFEEAGFEILPVLTAHALAVEALPPIHKDPFDRLIVAQALCEPMHLLSRDPAVLAYLPADVLRN